MRAEAFSKESMEKVGKAAYSVEEFLITVAKARDIEINELAMATVALILKRVTDASGSEVALTILEGIKEAIESLSAKEKK